jgi:hypothetical protein
VVGEDGPGHEMERSLMEGEDSLLKLRGRNLPRLYRAAPAGRGNQWKQIEH